MAAKIMPAAEFIRQCLDYDPETGSLIARARPREHFRTECGWKAANTRCAGKPFGWIIRMKSGITYRRCLLRNEEFLAHRVIYKLMTGNEPPYEIDHHDGDGLNNRWDNLREATHQQNQCNTKERTGTSYPRGVYRHAFRWVAEISADGKKHYLGTFATAEEAHQAYISASLRLHEGFSYKKRA